MKKALMIVALFCSLLTAFPIYSTESLITAKADGEVSDTTTADDDDTGGSVDDDNTGGSADDTEGTEAGAEDQAEEDETNEGETSENEDTDSNSKADEDGNSQNDSSENNIGKDDTLREDNDDNDFFNNFILYNFIWYNVFDNSDYKSMTETERKSQNSLLPMLQYYQNLNSKKTIYQQLNPQKGLFWMNSWMLNPKNKAERRVLLKNHLNSEAINKKFGKTYWITVGSKVINVPLKIYQKIKVGDKVQMVDNHYLKISQKMYYVK